MTESAKTIIIMPTMSQQILRWRVQNSFFPVTGSMIREALSCDIDILDPITTSELPYCDKVCLGRPLATL